jgi:hypothetical protein
MTKRTVSYHAQYLAYLVLALDLLAIFLCLISLPRF